MTPGTERTLQEPQHEIAVLAYDTKESPYKGFHVRASYLKAPKDRDAFIEIFRDGTLWRSYYYPAYRIYNIGAHFSDMVDEQLEAEAIEAVHDEPPEPDGECFRGGESASALAHEQAEIQRTLKR